MKGLFKLLFTKEYPSFSLRFYSHMYSFVIKSSSWLGVLGTVYVWHKPVFNFVCDKHALYGPSPMRHNHQWGFVRWTYVRQEERSNGRYVRQEERSNGR